MIPIEQRMKLLAALDEYASSDPSDANKDQNANAVDKSFDNFSGDLSNDMHTALTISAVDREYAKLFGHGGSVFWDREFHVNPGDPDFYFHDITKGLVPYCYAGSTSRIMTYGRPYANEYTSGRPKYFQTFIGQVTEYIMEMSKEHAGAIAIPDFFVSLGNYFVHESDIEMHRNELQQHFQSMIYILHNKFRTQGQSPFSNVTIADNETLTKVLGCQSADTGKIKLLQTIFLDEIGKGHNGIPFRFPVTTFNFAIDKQSCISDAEWLQSVAKYLKTCRYNIYAAQDVRKLASCCRLINDVDMLMKSAGIDSFGNGGVNIGSARVIALNLPHIVKKSGANYKLAIHDATILACKALLAHRELLRTLISGGTLKFFKCGWEKLDTQFFSTVGVIGLYEAASQAKTGDFYSLTDPSSIVKAEKEIVAVVNDASRMMAEMYKTPINLEQIPGESAAIKLARPHGVAYWSNQLLPLSMDYDFATRIQVGGELDRSFTGGAMTFLNLLSEPSEKQIIGIVGMCAKAGLAHFSPTGVFSRCNACGDSVFGKVKICRACGTTDMDYIAKIIGYWVPVSRWSGGRRQEFSDRIWYRVDQIGS